MIAAWMPQLSVFSDNRGLCVQNFRQRPDRRSWRRLRGSICLGQERCVNDRYDRALRGRRSFHEGIELARERLDDAGPEPGFWLSEDAVGLADPIVGDGK